MATGRKAQLIQEQIEARNAAEAILARAESENRALTDEEAAEVDAHQETAIRLGQDVSRIDRQVALSAGLPGRAPVLEVVRDEADQPWASRGEFLQAVARVEINPRVEMDPRLRAAASGASQGEPAAGGFLVPTGYSDQLLARAREESPILGLCRQIPIGDGMDSLELPVIDETSRATGSRWGGVQVYRKAEADTVAATRPKFGQLRIDASEIMGIAYATERLLRNAAALGAVFDDAFASEFAFKVTDELIRGGGGDSCLGLLDPNAPTVTQAKETGQAAATVVVENLSNMWAHVPARSKARGVWLINNDVEPQLDKLAITVGSAALEPRFVSYDAQGIMRIKGRPVLRLEQCATLGTVGDIIFADFGEYILSPKGVIDGQQSMHVRFLYNEMTFRWNYYINGRPAWLSAVTPYKGATSLSPFVTLATRS